jgi:hypothetical protein
MLVVRSSFTQLWSPSSGASEAGGHVSYLMVRRFSAPSLVER